MTADVGDHASPLHTSLTILPTRPAFLSWADWSVHSYRASVSLTRLSPLGFPVIAMLTWQSNCLFINTEPADAASPWKAGCTESPVSSASCLRTALGQAGPCPSLDAVHTFYVVAIILLSPFDLAPQSLESATRDVQHRDQKQKGAKAFREHRPLSQPSRVCILRLRLVASHLEKSPWVLEAGVLHFISSVPSSLIHTHTHTETKLFDLPRFKLASSEQDGQCSNLTVYVQIQGAYFLSVCI